MISKKILLVIFCSSLFFCSQHSKTENLRSDHFGFLIKKGSKELVDGKLYDDEAMVSVADDQVLIQVSSVGDTLEILRRAISKDSLDLMVKLTVIYRMKKNETIEAYTKFGYDFREILYEPEILKITRDKISSIKNSAYTAAAFKEELTIEVSKHLQANYAELLEIYEVDIYEIHNNRPFLIR
jgi:hypothetical protein